MRTRLTICSLMQELPGIVIGNGAHVSRIVVIPEVNRLAIIAVAAGAPLAIRELTSTGITVDSFVGVDVGACVNDAFLHETNQETHGDFVHEGGKVVIGVGRAVKPAHQLVSRHSGRGLYAGETGRMGTISVCAIQAGVIPTVAFLAAPGIRTTSLITTLGSPQRLVVGRRFYT